MTPFQFLTRVEKGRSGICAPLQEGAKGAGLQTSVSSKSERSTISSNTKEQLLSRFLFCTHTCFDKVWHVTLTLLIIWSDFNNNDFLLLLQIHSFQRVKGWIFKHLVLQVRWHPLSTLIDRFLVLTDATTPVPHVFVRDYIPPPPQLKRGVNQIQSSQSW